MKKVDKEGNIFYYNKDKQLHRTDGPAVIYSEGDKYWYQNGKKHRLANPAVEGSNGYKAWYQNGKRHRLDGPAIIFSSENKEWYADDKLFGRSSSGYTQEQFEEDYEKSRRKQ